LRLLTLLKRLLPLALLGELDIRVVGDGNFLLLGGQLLLDHLLELAARQLAALSGGHLLELLHQHARLALVRLAGVRLAALLPLLVADDLDDAHIVLALADNEHAPVDEELWHVLRVPELDGRPVEVSWDEAAHVLARRRGDVGALGAGDAVALADGRRQTRGVENARDALIVNEVLGELHVHLRGVVQSRGAALDGLVGGQGILFRPRSAGGAGDLCDVAAFAVHELVLLLLPDGDVSAVDQGQNLEGEGVLGNSLGGVLGMLNHQLLDVGRGQESEQLEKLFDLVVGPSGKVSVQVKGAGHEGIEPDGVTCTLAELGAGVVRQERHSETNWVVLPGLGHSHVGVLLRGSDRLDGLDSGHNVAELVRTSDLHLDAELRVQMPKVPSLHQWVNELREGHAVALFHLVLDAIPAEHRSYPHITTQPLHDIVQRQALPPHVVVDEMPLGRPIRLRAVLAPERLDVGPNLLQLVVDLCDVHRHLAVRHNLAGLQTVRRVAYSARRAADQRHSRVAVEVHPEKWHEGEEMADVEGRCRRIDSNVCTYSFGSQEFFDLWCSPCDVLDVTSFLKDVPDILNVSLLNSLGTLRPLLLPRAALLHHLLRYPSWPVLLQLDHWESGASSTDVPPQLGEAGHQCRRHGEWFV
ncbi:hypothetical protein CI238_06698, partial [Colletotrichum incanum]